MAKRVVDNLVIIGAVVFVVMFIYDKIQTPRCSHQWKQGASQEQYKKYLEKHQVDYPVNVFECRICDKVKTESF